MYPNPIIVSRGIVASSLTLSALPRAFRHLHHFLDIALYRRFLGAVGDVVPSPRGLHCARIFWLAIATNITSSRPVAVVALVLKPSSPLMASMEVTWLSPGSTPLCTSLAILWQSALVSGGTSNDTFRILWLLVRVRSCQTPKNYDTWLSDGNKIVAPGMASALALAQSSSSSFCFNQRSLCA